MKQTDLIKLHLEGNSKFIPLVDFDDNITDEEYSQIVTEQLKGAKFLQFAVRDGVTTVYLADCHGDVVVIAEGDFIQKICNPDKFYAARIMAAAEIKKLYGVDFDETANFNFSDWAEMLDADCKELETRQKSFSGNKKIPTPKNMKKLA